VVRKSSPGSFSRVRSTIVGIPVLFVQAEHISSASRSPSANPKTWHEEKYTALDVQSCSAAKSTCQVPSTFVATIRPGCRRCRVR
jgi:hypothetical protein